MRKVIAAINMTLDGYCDHTSAIADAQLHQHYTDMLNSAGALLYGRTTYQMMASYWPELVKNPTGNKSDDDFAVAIENVPKIVFSRTMKSVGWKNARLANLELKEEVSELTKQPGKDVFVGSRSLIEALTKLGLIDEYHLCVHPVLGGSELALFKDSIDRNVLRLLRIKTFDTGVIALYYERSKE